MRGQRHRQLIDYTSSPLRNEGSNSQMAMLAVGYPSLFHLLGRTEMSTTDFFAWDIVAGNRHILRKVLKLIRSRIHQFWWSVPRLIDAMRSPYEIVLPAQGWPKGAFKDTPPTRSYRLHYLRDTLHGLAAPDDVLEEPRPVARSGFWLKRMALSSITFAETKLGKTRRKLVRRTLAAQQASEKLPRGTLYWLRGISVLLSGKKSLKRNVSPSIHWGDGKENERIQPSSTLHFRTDIPRSQHKWKDHDEYQKVFDRLLRDLQTT